MDRAKRTLGLVAGAAAAFAAMLAADDLDAARAARSRNRLRVVSVNVDGLDDVRLNHVIELRFNARVAKSSLKNGSLAVVPYDEQTDTTGAPRPGTLTKKGRTVRFVPTLPTNARVPGDPNADFYPAGSPEDDPFENGSLRPGTDYRVVAAGHDRSPSVRSRGRGRLRDTSVTGFRTIGELAGVPLFEPEEWIAPSPPDVLFTNPPDTPLAAFDGYTSTAGTRDVPKGATITVFGKGIPLDPVALRAPGAVELLKIAPLAEGEDPAPVAGDVLVEQDRTIANVVFRPEGLLEDECTYALRIADTVTDIAGEAAIPDDAARANLRDAYDYLAASRRISPGTPPEHLPDPPARWIEDWPIDPDERGELKARLLEVGDTQPLVIDPRVVLVFTARLEPVVRVQESQAAKRRAGSARASVARAFAPLGLQGAAGAGKGVLLPFTLADDRSRDGAVEAEFGVDVNDDGVIEDEEFRPLTMDRRDPRNTGAQVSRGEWRFPTAPGAGRTNALVWNSAADLVGNHRIVDVLYDDQGRQVEDPGAPGRPVFLPAGTGVEVRIRSRRGPRSSRGWVYTRPFELVSSNAPELTIDEVTPGVSTAIAWSAIDRDSEDADGDGVYEFPELGDLNGNGLFDTAGVAVAFDFVVLAPGEDVGALTREQLALLDWTPCTRDESTGDPDVDLVATQPPGTGHVFAWDHAADGVLSGDRVIVRGRTFDDTRLHSAWEYRTAPATISD